jgi:membrane protease YdiL (CAAX protease family)
MVKVSNLSSLRWDWKLEQGVASPFNFVVLLVVLFSFPFVLSLSGALSFSTMDVANSLYEHAFYKFCATVGIFLWICFFIALIGILRRKRVTILQFIGVRLSSVGAIARNIGVSFLALAAMAVVGNLSNAVLSRFQLDSTAFRAMTAHNSGEALAFLFLALSAGFVEEFVFRGYIQKQCQALCGSAWLASILQLAIFTQGHIYQGWTRLIPVVLIGAILTAVALWRKTLAPGMLAHGFGDGMVAFSFFLKHL